MLIYMIYANIIGFGIYKLRRSSGNLCTLYQLIFNDMCLLFTSRYTIASIFAQTNIFYTHNES